MLKRHWLLFSLGALVVLLPIAFVIVDNAGYGAMRSFAQLHGSKRSPDFSIRGVDFCALASAFGIPARRVDAVHDLAPSLREALAWNGPMLIDVTVDDAARKLF